VPYLVINHDGITCPLCGSLLRLPRLTIHAFAGSKKGPSSTIKEASYTWQEVAKHNTAESVWIIHLDNVYDVTDFLSSHPGGQELLLLAAGRDITELLEMYHCFSLEKVMKQLHLFKIGTLSGPTEFPRFAPDASGFYKTVTARVKTYFDARPKGALRSPWTGLIRMLPIIALGILCFALVHNMLGSYSFPVKFAAAVVYGVCQVLPLMHWLHDASHGALGPNETWWKFFGRLSMDWIAGANIMPWHHQHIIGHHVYTNVFEGDPDLPAVEKGDPRRLVKRQFWASFYKYQHIYMPVLYGVLGIKIRISDFVDFMYHKMNGPVRVNHYDNVWIRVFLVKAIWVAWRILVPIYVLNVPAMEVLGYMVVSDIVSGYWLAFNFQVRKAFQ
jgi:hypothetical protein